MIVAGIDEAGRGCWAGPLVACAVVLNNPIQGITDSKKLSRQARNALMHTIYKHASLGVGFIHASEVDAIGLTKATTKAMDIALSQVKAHYDKIIIDGNYNYLKGPSFQVKDKQLETIIKADATVPEVGAASIVAKVVRDTYMIQTAHLQHPEYSFDQHVGYGTALHLQNLKKFGVCAEHRRSYKPIRVFL